MDPLYQKLCLRELEKKAAKAWALLSPCQVCPRKCGVDRAHDSRDGFCKMGAKARIAATHPHFGEETCLVGKGGSGSIFFSSCNLSCVFCQNFTISQLRQGEEIKTRELAGKMLSLQHQGCENINLVSPSIWAPQILKALIPAREQGLSLPLVYNTGGYDSVEVLKILEGVVDIYLPDIKYGSNQKALKYSNASHYWTVVQKAVREMYRQVGDLVLDPKGVAQRGVLIRHLVLPHNIGGTEKVMEFVASLSERAAVNVMGQYRPYHRAEHYPKLNRPVTKQEVRHALEAARKKDLRLINQKS